MLGKCKEPEKAQSLFEMMVEEGCVMNQEAYTALLSAYSRSGRFHEAFSILEEMKNIPNCLPDVFTYTILIKSCLQFYDFDKVQILLSDMECMGIKPNTVTYNTLIDSYGKAKRFDCYSLEVLIITQLEMSFYWITKSKMRDETTETC